jgi:hypothetical protein
VSRPRFAALAFVLWTIFGLLWATTATFGADGDISGRALREAASHIVVFYWAWALVTPLVWFVARRATRLWASRIRLIGFVLVYAPVVILAQGIAYLGLLALLRIETIAGPGVLARFFARHAGGDLATYLTLVGVYLLLDASRRAREGERAAAELLRFQLQPHFLFNALNTVSTLVLKADNDSAIRAIELVSRYLRDALALQPEAMVTLREELATVDRYLDIERLRFGEALKVSTQATPDALGVRLPGSLLQPLVENAIRHGFRGNGADDAIMLQATVSNRRLLVTVTDQGPGAGAAGADAGGFGLRYVQERLRQRYGSNASFTLSVSPSGAEARLDLPMTV